MISWTVTHEDSWTCSTLPTSNLERNHHLHSRNWVNVWMNCGIGFIDADWAGDTDTLQSHTGYILMMNGGPISWKSCWQDNVSLSTSKPEFFAASQPAQEVVYLRETLRDFGYPQSTASDIFELLKTAWHASLWAKILCAESSLDALISVDILFVSRSKLVFWNKSHFAHTKVRKVDSDPFKRTRNFPGGNYVRASVREGERRLFV